MTQTLTLPQFNLIAYWRFDEGTGLNALDSSGQGHTGALVNGPLWVQSTVTVTPPQTNPPPQTTYGNVTLDWNPSPSTPVSGYRIKYGPSSGNYTNTSGVTTALTLTVSNVLRGFTYYYAVFAYDPSNLESPPSNEVNYQLPQIIIVTNKPSPITGVKVN